jgi:hypothetical protein
MVLVADYQTIIDREGPSSLRRDFEELVADYLAVGIDPGRTTIFAHSQVPELNQLMVPLTYPVHQAADILFCHGNVVPVGNDQLPHLEMTRMIARRWPPCAWSASRPTSLRRSVAGERPRSSAFSQSQSTSACGPFGPYAARSSRTAPACARYSWPGPRRPGPRPPRLSRTYSASCTRSTEQSRVAAPSRSPWDSSLLRDETGPGG